MILNNSLIPNLSCVKWKQLCLYVYLCVQACAHECVCACLSGRLCVVEAGGSGWPRGWDVKVLASWKDRVRELTHGYEKGMINL